MTLTSVLVFVWVILLYKPDRDRAYRFQDSAAQILLLYPLWNTL